MAVHLVDGVTELIDDASSKIALKAVDMAKGYAPVDTGQLKASIMQHKMGLASWLISTDAYGDNGFQYPARIEAGQEVVATHAKALRFVTHGHEVWTKRAAPSSKSHFAKKTISNLHI